MKPLTNAQLKQENEQVAGSGGRSEDNRDLGFRPAFFDMATCLVHLSRYRDGRPAPFHLLDGLPEEVVIIRSSCGHVITTKSTLIAGFERKGFFYPRSAAARAVAEWTPPARIKLP